LAVVKEKEKGLQNAVVPNYVSAQKGFTTAFVEIAAFPGIAI
jgi:hypothetical protein